MEQADGGWTLDAGAAWPPNRIVEEGLSPWRKVAAEADDEDEVAPPPGLAPSDVAAAAASCAAWEQAAALAAYEAAGGDLSCGGINAGFVGHASWGLDDEAAWDMPDDDDLFDHHSGLCGTPLPRPQRRAYYGGGRAPGFDSPHRQDPLAPCYIALSTQVSPDLLLKPATATAADACSSVYAVVTQQWRTGRRKQKKRRSKLEERGPVSIELGSDSEATQGTPSGPGNGGCGFTGGGANGAVGGGCGQPAANTRIGSVVDSRGMPLDVNDLGTACISRTVMEDLALTSRLEASDEVWDRCADRRLNELNIVKHWAEYRDYLAKAPKELRTASEPSTPDHNDRSKSKRQWKREVGDWREAIMALELWEARGGDRVDSGAGAPAVQKQGDPCFQDGVDVEEQVFPTGPGDVGGGAGGASSGPFA